MENSGLVSVITPTYNRREFIVEAIESVLAQTYPNWQMLIIDDGSTDDSIEVIKPYLKDERIQYFYQENQGQAFARQQALKKAEGEYVAFLDSDNLWLPERLALGVEALKNNHRVDVCYGDLITIDEKGQVISTANMKRYSGWIAPLMMRQNFVSMNTTLIRKHAIDRVGGFRSTVTRGDDYDLYFRIAAESKYLYLAHRLAKYRVMENQISSNKEARFESDLEIIANFTSNYPKAISRIQWLRGMSSRFVNMARYYSSNGEKINGIAFSLKAVLYAPWWIGSWRVLLKSIVG